MRAATVQEIKQELVSKKPAELVALCLRLSRFKKENKELLTYLLFEANDETGFVRSVKEEIDELFAGINLSQLYFAKKSLRKILRIINKYCRYSAEKATEVELRLYLCRLIRESKIPIKQNNVIHNLYNGQLKKAASVIDTLHEDLQYEYLRELEEIKG